MRKIKLSTYEIINYLRLHFKINEDVNIKSLEEKLNITFTYRELKEGYIVKYSFIKNDDGSKITS